MSSKDAQGLFTIEDRYQVRLTPYYASLMDLSKEGREHCPIRKQAIPLLEETDPILPDWAKKWSLEVYKRESPWINDPIGDLQKLVAPRLTHRYEHRALLHVSSSCAVFCRFCFRKSHLNDKDRTLYDGSLEPALEYLKAHTEIRELILTGGDPLSLSDQWFHDFFQKIKKIDHLKHLRIHSRMPVTLPSRLTKELAEILSHSPTSTVSLVTHFNHPREITKFAIEKMSLFSRQGIKFYNQTVLLKDVNDDSKTLFHLFQTLYEEGVTPIYLHHPDWTPGTFHFRLSIERGQRIMRELAGRLSGPAMPHYVLDVPGGFGKVQLLDATRVRKIRNHQSDDIGGAMYQIDLPQTCVDATTSISSQTRLYAEFWRV